MSTENVEAYYDANTRRFLRFGQGGQVGVIHRAVWGPGVSTREQALNFVHERLLDVMPDETHRVLDLGCGVGASLQYLAERRPIDGVGVTLSPVQVELAHRRFGAAGVADRLTCRQADFTQLPADLGTFDFAYGIESFVHAPDAEPFFEQAGHVVRPGGVLVLCDDFAADRVEAGDLSRREARWVREFRAGWNVASFISVERAVGLAEAHGFALAHDEDLTGDLELRRPRDRLITALVRVGRHLPIRSPWWLNMLGGNALQMALMRRLATYRLLVWTRL